MSGFVLSARQRKLIQGAVKTGTERYMSTFLISYPDTSSRLPDGFSCHLASFVSEALEDEVGYRGPDKFGLEDECDD